MDLRKGEKVLELLEIESQKIKGLAETRKDLSAAATEILAVAENFSTSAATMSDSLTVVTQLKASVEDEMNKLYRQQSGFVREVDGVVTDKLNRASAQIRSDIREDAAMEFRRAAESVQSANQTLLDRITVLDESIALQASKGMRISRMTLLLLLALVGLEGWRLIEPLIRAGGSVAGG